MAARSDRLVAEALEPLLHMLGLGPRHPDPWRNHFVLGPRHPDQGAIQALVEAGLAELVGTQDPGVFRVGGAVFQGVRLGDGWGVPLRPGDRLYCATEAGRAIAVAEARRRWPLDDDDDRTDPHITEEVPRAL